MKKTLFILASVAALGTMGYFGTWVSAQNANNNVVPASAQATPKIAVVNIFKVLKEFQKANYLGETLIKESQTEENKLKEMQGFLEKEEIRIRGIADPALRATEEKALAHKKTDFQNQTVDYRKKMQDKQAVMAVEVHSNISSVIDVLAKSKGYEMVMVYPDVVQEKDKEGRLLPLTQVQLNQRAFTVLSPSAATVAWVHPSLDITDAVILTLNYNFKPPAGTVPPPGTPR